MISFWKRLFCFGGWRGQRVVFGCREGCVGAVCCACAVGVEFGRERQHRLHSTVELRAGEK